MLTEKQSIIIKYLKYSGLWVGLVFNPCHWQFGFKDSHNAWENLFDNCLHLGPIWIRVIIDDGRW